MTRHSEDCVCERCLRKVQFSQRFVDIMLTHLEQYPEWKQEEILSRMEQRVEGLTKRVN